jgi:hypothetical protein
VLRQQDAQNELSNVQTTAQIDRMQRVPGVDFGSRWQPR